METNLTHEELNETNGGARASAVTIALVVAGVVSFVAGIINGYQRPLTCGSTK